MSDVEDKLDEIAEKKDVPLKRVREEYETLKEQTEASVYMDSDDSVILPMVESNLNRIEQTSGEFKEAAVLPLGRSGIRTWKNTGDLVITKGIVHFDEGTDGICAFQCTEKSGMDLDRVMDAFTPNEDGTLKPLRASFPFEVAEEFVERDRTYYVARSNERSKFAVVEPSTLPEDDVCADIPEDGPGQRTILHQPDFFPERATLADITDHIAEEYTYIDNKGKEQSAFVDILGLDMVRFEGQVQDVSRRLTEECEGDENPYGRITVTDESIEPEEFEELATTHEYQRVLGLDVWLAPQLLDFGPNSRVEIYGTITADEEGRVSMNGDGVIPLLKFPYESESEGYSKEPESI